MTLFLIHCGYYDDEISDGIYEFHINIPVVATDIEGAKRKVRLDTLFQKKKMHIDGIQEIKAIDGYCVELRLEDETSRTTITNHQYRDL